MLTRPTGWSLVIAGLLLWAGLPAGTATAEDPPAAPCSVRTVESYPWHVVRKGELELIGLKANSFVAYAVKSGVWKPIRIQVDEVNSEGDYVLEGGMPFTKATDDGVFDANDEVVLSGPELGDDFKDAEIKPELLVDARRAHQVKVCIAERFYGAALVVGRNRPVTTMWNPMVSLNVERLEVAAMRYRYLFRKDNPALLGEVYLRDDARNETTVFASSDFQMVLKLPWYVPDFTLTNDDFTSMIESWQAGPVRTIVAVGVKFRKFLSLFNFHLFSELVFYERGFQIPTIIEFPFEAHQYMKPGSGIAYALSFPKGRKWTIETNLKPLPEQSAEEVLKSGQTADFTEEFHALARRPEGAVKVTVHVDEAARKMVPPPFYVRENQFGSGPWSKYWEWLLDMEGDLGVFLDISRVRKGRYDFGLDLLLSPKAHENFVDYGQAAAEWSSVTLPRKSP